MQSTVSILVDQWFLCKRSVAPAAVRDCNGLSTTNKSSSPPKGGQRFGSIARNWGMQTKLVGWLKETQKDDGGTNKGRAAACMGKKGQAIGKRVMFQTPVEPCFRGLWPLKVLRSWRRISQMSLQAFVSQSRQLTRCSTLCTLKWTFHWKQQNPRGAHHPSSFGFKIE